MTFIWVSLLIGVVSAIYCHKMAQSKHRPAVFWGTMGILFGPFALIVLMFLKRIDEKPESE
ncbi:hypothetical protein QCB45_07445 [Thiomicrorhabdus sp. ZW0627]|uniref:hypothetical protein n=1 Tax=Thiomicrorhabdus sp. ZW0627 TaxID=3039774 RepID=UPI002436A6EA|nr:hypothetical protein [Thiomicrorhabdus sp. ZW0627]MDG6774162.1 hypothetical protein [Thiomicrorhabdus sp. ZW0627]